MATNQTFVDFVTPVPADWLNNVNFVVNQYPYSSLSSYTYPGTGAVSRTYSNKFSTEQVSVLDFGAKGDGITDDTTAFRNAVATGKRVIIPDTSAFYLIKDAITITQSGQVIEGFGDNSLIKIDSTFNMAATAVFVVSSAQPGPQFKNFKVTCVQPDTAVRGSLTAYPPAFYFQSVPRTQFVNVEVSLFMNAFDARGNTGGAVWDNCRVSAFTNSILIDGAQDSIRIQTSHFWPFDMTSNQLSIYSSSGTVGINTARCDDLHIEDCLIFSYEAIACGPGGTGNTFGEVTGCDFDTNSNVTLNAGELRFSNCGFTTAGAGRQWVVATNGAQGKFTNCEFLVGTTDTTTLIQVTGAPAAGIPGTLLQFSNCRLSTGVSDQTMVNVSGGGTGFQTPTVMFNNCFFSKTGGIAYASDVIIQGTNGRVHMNGCRISGVSTGSGVFLGLGADDTHIITNNCFGGYKVTLPASHGSLLFDNNTQVSTGTLAYGQVNTTTSGAGAVTVSHNYGAAPSAVFINVVNSTTPIFAQATNFAANSFQVNFWSSGGAALASTAIIFDWRMVF